MIFIVFILFLYISYSVPLTGDDWTNYLFKVSNFGDAVRISVEKYLAYEGRLFSRIVILLLTYNRVWWNVLNAVVMGVVFGTMNHFSNNAKVNTLPLIIALSILMVPNETFRQTYVWITGNLTYMLPIGLLFVYIQILYMASSESNSKPVLYGMLLTAVAFFNSMMVEHVSALMIFVSVYFVAKQYYRNKSIDLRLLPSTLISLIGFMGMYFSPGVKSRMLSESVEFYNFSIIEKIWSNLGNFVSNTFIMNSFMLLLLTFVVTHMISRRYSGSKRYLAWGIISIIPIMTVILNSTNFLYDKSGKYRVVYDLFKIIIDPNNGFVQAFWLFFAITFIWLILTSKKINERLKITEFFLFGLVTNGAMMFSPVWGARTSVATLFLIYTACFVYIGYNTHPSKRYESPIFVTWVSLFVSVSTYMIILYSSVSSQQSFREKSIQYQIQEGNSIIKVERFPKYTLWNAEAWNSFHEERFRAYYGIDSSKKIEWVLINYRYYIFYAMKSPE